MDLGDNIDLRLAVSEAWAEFVVAAAEDRENAKARYRALLEEFTEQIRDETPEVR
jgi:hypothetical protein